MCRLKAVDGFGGKKESVAKGFVSNLTKGSGSTAGGGQGVGGDWHCPRCKILVFASKTQCFLCHTAKTDFTAAQLAAAAAGTQFTSFTGTKVQILTQQALAAPAAAADASTDKGKDKKKDGDAAPVAAVAVTCASTSVFTLCANPHLPTPLPSPPCPRALHPSLSCLRNTVLGELSHPSLSCLRNTVLGELLIDMPLFPSPSFICSECADAGRCNRIEVQ